MKYPILLFDADDTLFDFSQASSYAFTTLCQTHDIPDTTEIRALYHSINKPLWASFDRGEITKEFLTVERFVRFFAALGLERDAVLCNETYLGALGQGVFPLPHAETVCQTLKERGHRLFLITNAVASVQRSRLNSSVFSQFFEQAFISEEAGASKPSKAYFDYVCTCVPKITPQNTLVIGDSLSTDIRGANNAGLPCCWYNPGKKDRPSDLCIDYEIHDLRELLQIA